MAMSLGPGPSSRPATRAPQPHQAEETVLQTGPTGPEVTESFARNPFLEMIGLRLTLHEADRAEFRLIVDERHLNLSGRLHGGVIATMLDVCCGYAGLEPSVAGVSRGGLTLSLAVNYLSGIASGEVVAGGRVTGGGAGIYFAAGEVRSAEGALLATAQGSFKRLK